MVMAAPPLSSTTFAFSTFSSSFFFFAVSSLLINPAASDTKSADVSALNVIFQSLNSPSQLSGWKSNGGDPCDKPWQGITCSGSSVTEIKLPGLGLSGTLGYQLSSLTSVTYFDFSKNNLHGDIPYQLPPNALHIDLAGNTLTGGIPYSISQMTDLEYLNLAGNQLKGQMSDMFGKLQKMSELDLSFNHFSGDLPESFGSLRNLKTLHLQNNQFSGSINVLADLPLDDLNVQNNQFTGQVPPKLKDIDNLQIDGTSLSGSSSSKKGGKAKGMNIAIIAGVVIAVLLVIVLLLAVLRKAKSSSASSPYIDEHSYQNRSFTPLADNELIEQAVVSSSLNLKGLQTSPPMDLKPPPPGPHESLNENEFSVKLNKHSIGHAHAITYSLIDLRAATGSFSSSRLLGEGSIGSVYKAKYADGKVLTVKKIDSKLPGDSSSAFMDIIAAISRMHHPNISELIGFCSESGYQLLVYEFQRNESLHEFLHLSDDYSRPLTWDTRVRIALETARALEYLHEVCSPSSIHKNIKSANILLDAELNAHLSECGLTAYYEGQNLSPGYDAPEFTNTRAYTLKSDIYSFGVVMLELLTGRRPFDSSKPMAEQSLVSWAIPQLHDMGSLKQMVDPALHGLYPPKSLSRFADVIAQCVLLEPELRPAMTEVVRSLAQCVRPAGINNKLSGKMSTSLRSDDSDYGYY
ncbi:uncharacterized protein A4U43_C01F350 [Asparagus officinalis]|uniref:Protein kinase domain-containing protein n=1 Tax=Asparagus officinalis TaxID=4686 RepID=A0A5P1FMA5_ASPOF|nr:protein STRUBBELIG-RECEPTOR FAMILY 5-like [Asparagus officinalis]ONK78863.1 uncharacterized protein A4U43_C01F350 [Asparagus officinalis]